MKTTRKHSSTPVEAPPHNGFSLISNEKLLQLYTTMLKCRMIEQRISTLAKQNTSIETLMAANEEAVATGIVLDLLPGDTLAPSHGGFIPSFVKGRSLEAIFGRIFSSPSRQSAKSRPRYAALNLIPPSLSLGVQLERAIGAAVDNKKCKKRGITVAFCGSSTDPTGHLYEAMRHAGKLSLPILLVCHSDSASEEIGRQAQDCGFPGVTVDSDDAVAAYRVATEAITHARRGSGPTLIECKPWVLSGHSSGRRPTARNPILRMEEYLTRKGLFDRKLKSAVTASFRRELDDAIKITQDS